MFLPNREESVSEETGKGPARVENHGKGMFYVDVGGKVLSEYFDTFGAAELVCMEINAVIEPLSRKAALCDRMADILALILPMAKGYAFDHPVGSNQKYVELAEEVKAEYDREATK